MLINLRNQNNNNSDALKFKLLFYPKKIYKKNSMHHIYQSNTEKGRHQVKNYS